MKVVIISAFDTYFDRVRMVKHYFEKKKNEVLVITSDFSHRNKTTVKYVRDANILVHARPYKKNLSLGRLYSHLQLSKAILKKVKELKPDLIYCLIPSNSLARQLGRYKEKYPNVKLYFDIIDLWPEAMPVDRFLSLPPFQYWKNLRDHHLDQADRVFTECSLYQSVLHKEEDPKYETLYWARSERPCSFSDSITDKELHFVYLGSINNIIDIDFITRFLSQCNEIKPTFLHIIGQGESKAKLVESLQEKKITVIDHGSVFSQEKKQAIFDQCNFALNIMKPSVVVGLTMKSLDYLCGGVPIINTIQADTAHLVKNYNIGYNIEADTMAPIIEKICSMSRKEQLDQRYNCRKVYRELFLDTSFENKLERAGV